MSREPSQFARSPYSRRILTSLKVSHLSQHEQRAVAHLKERLIKERVTLNTRKRTVSAPSEVGKHRVREVIGGESVGI